MKVVLALSLVAAVALAAPSWNPFNINSAASSDGAEQRRAGLLREEIIKTSQEIDQVFVMDVTGSMGPYIETAKARVLELVSELQDALPHLKLRVAFVGYRDVD